ncbi:hypothetical protein CDD81_3946 [Ophiocordyceps australis]|uniref:MIF4G domain-containing protein n=1 Tax=Ophiocordyceps australis TaxID=1399860 RepID=A0A2C5X734_9HYPO|nr:hypothetical protein CDD81_3946 [Ophiocordyceps australis]
MDRVRKRELRVLNQRAWNGDKDVIVVGDTLDSSLKKNTAFIKRLRTAITPATLSTFLHEIRTLSLHKYLSEIISACYEGLCRLKSSAEIDAGAEIVSALHQRFGPVDFTSHLAWLLGRGMAMPDKSFLKTLTLEARDKEEKDRITRQRALIRVITELWLIGVIRTLEDAVKPDEASKGSKTIEVKARTTTPKIPSEPFPIEVLKDLLGHDREHANLPLVVVFVKAFSWDVLGIRPTASEGRRMADDDGLNHGARPSSPLPPPASEPDQPLTPSEVSEKIRNILKRYFDDIVTHITRDQKAIQSQARRNAEVYVKSGEVFEDRQANHDRLVKAQDRLVSNTQILADAIGAEMPDLKDSEDSFATSSSSIGLVKTADYLRSTAEGPGIWADEDERRFYENLVDLKGKVPSILLEEGKKKKPDADEQVGRKVEAAEATENAKPSETSAAVTEDMPTAIANRSIGAQVDALLARLPELTDKEAIDQTAIDFCFVNSKASRNRLVKALTEVPKGRSDLLPSWSRLVATLGRHMPDIPKGLVEYLDAEFRSLQRRKDKDFLGQVRLSNIRYLAELTKFGVVPEHVVFHCLKVTLDDFSRINIEILCNLIENCGRYLLKNPETAPRMASFLETLQRKKSVQHIGQPERMLIDNAVYYVDPPERPAIEQKERTPIDIFIRKLIYSDLNKRNYSKILKQLRRLHWEEADVVAILERIFSKPGKVKYGNIQLLAILLSSLHRYHSDFVVKVIDNVIESVSIGLEHNDFRFFQRRVAEIRYLGELYNYRVLEHPVIFDTLYHIVTFGYGGPPLPGRFNPYDPPDDFFRIRLVATMLETCGMYFNRGTAGKKLDYFLSFFQYYVLTKASLPLEIDFLVEEVFARTRPQWKLLSSIDEAAKSLQLAIAQDQKTAGADRVMEQDDVSSGPSSDEDNGDVDDGEAYGDDESASDEDEAEDDDDEYSNCESVYDDDDVVVSRQQEMVDPQIEADFEREYAKMMTESLESRKFERKQLFDVPLPVRPKNREPPAPTAMEDSAATPQRTSTMAFSLLTKKGNRQQTRTVELPSDSTFAVAMKTQQRAEKEEQQRIKNLVLNYDLHQSEDQEGKCSPFGYLGLSFSLFFGGGATSG